MGTIQLNLKIHIISGRSIRCKSAISDTLFTGFLAVQVVWYSFLCEEIPYPVYVIADYPDRRSNAFLVLQGPKLLQHRVSSWMTRLGLYLFEHHMDNSFSAGKCKVVPELPRTELPSLVCFQFLTSQYSHHQGIFSKEPSILLLFRKKIFS